MHIAVFQFGDPWYALASTSLVNGLLAAYPGSNIHWITSSENLPLFQYNKRLAEVCVGENSLHRKCDLAINLTPSPYCCQAMKSGDFGSRSGFVFDKNEIGVSDVSLSEILGVANGEQKTSKHVLQILFKLAGLKWRGEGYDLTYYPRNKMSKTKTGVAVDDDSLRQFIWDNLHLEYSKLWHVPMKQNLLKRIDEINRVKRIITNDWFCLHAAIALKKHVEFVDNQNYNMSVEFFGSGNHYRIET